MLRLILCLLLWTGAGLVNADEPHAVHLAILADQVERDQIQARYQPLADYLNQALDGMDLGLVVLGQDQLEEAVRQNRVDLVLTSPSHYLVLRSQHALSGVIATRVVRAPDGEPTSALGGVMFVDDARVDIKTLEDMAGRRVAIPGTALTGAYLANLFELEQRAPGLRKQLSLQTYPGQDAVIEAVRNGEADVGFVSSGVLEKDAGGSLAQWRVLNPQRLPAYPYALSTRLYPEWPLVALPQLGQSTLGQVVAALLRLQPDHAAARAAGLAGFTPAVSYLPVERAARVLRLRPYDLGPAVSWGAVWRSYRIHLLVGVLIILTVLALGALILLRNAQLRQSHEALSESHRELGSVLDNLIGMAYRGRLDDSLTLEFVSRGVVELTGYQADEVLKNRRVSFASMIHPDDRDLVRDAIAAGLAGNGRFELEYRIVTRGGQVRYVAERGCCVRDTLGAWAFREGFIADNTDFRQAQAQLRLSASVFVHASEGIMITDANNHIVDVNKAFTRITGYARHEVIGRDPEFLRSDRYSKEFYASLWQELQQNGCWSGEVWDRRKNGEVYPLMLAINAVRDKDEIKHYVAIFLDITSQKAQQSKLEYVARYDALTDLPNRVSLADHMKQAMAQTRRHDQHLAVAYIDLDGFKAVNDTHGHETGDELLIAVASRMKLTLRESDTVARIGGDEFVAVLGDLGHPGDALPELNRLLHAIAAPVNVSGHELRVWASIGVTYFPQDGEVDADQLLRQADQAMYQAKMAGKNRYCLFDTAMDRNLRGQHASRERIRVALENDQFRLFYQPKVNMRYGQMIGVEALLRLHDGQAWLAPEELLQHVQNHELSVQVGEWVIARALSQIRAWQEQGLHTRISVNIDAFHLQHETFVPRLEQLLRQHADVQPHQLMLEVLETSALQDIKKVAGIMQACADIGVPFSIDDFGTGYSSLTYLKHLPATELKVDRSFVRDARDDPEDLAILEGVLGLATAFQRDVIAEGVESPDHGALLLQLGCEHAQGFWIARPMPASAVPAWAAHWQPHASWQSQGLLNRQDLALLFAKVEHQAWIRALERRLLQDQDLSDLVAPRCRFQHWLDNEGQQRHGWRQEYARLRHLHQELHRMVQGLPALQAEAGSAVALGRLGTVRLQCQALVDELDALIELNAVVPLPGGQAAEQNAPHHRQGAQLH